MRNFWAQNGPFPQMKIFFRKPINEPCFFHSCLSTCQKSKSDINLLVKYWQLKNTEISLVESFGYNLVIKNTIISLVITWEPDFSRECSFRRMLMNHKNYHFTQIPDKTNDVTFLKTQKLCFLAFLCIFGHFCMMGIFSKKSGCHTQLYMGT